jgi:hypothetical protein
LIWRKKFKMVERFEAIETNRIVAMLGRLETVAMLQMLETIETLERFRVAEMLGRLETLGKLDMLETIEMLEMLGELLSIYDHSGCCDWPMDAAPVELSQIATRTRTVPLGRSPCAPANCRQPTRHGGSVLVVESRHRL